MIPSSRDPEGARGSELARRTNVSPSPRVLSSLATPHQHRLLFRSTHLGPRITSHPESTRLSNSISSLTPADPRSFIISPIQIDTNNSTLTFSLADGVTVSLDWSLCPVLKVLDAQGRVIHRDLSFKGAFHPSRFRVRDPLGSDPALLSGDGLADLLCDVADLVM